MQNSIEGFGNGVKFYIGIVEDNADPISLMRVRVRWYGVHPEDRQEVPTTSLPWATVVQPSNSSSNSGVGLAAAILPGTLVLGFFSDGDECQFPWVIGTIPSLNRPNSPGYGNGFISDGSQQSSSQGPSGTTGSGSNATSTDKSYGNVSGDKPYHGSPISNPNSDGDKQINASTYGGNINTGDVRVSGDQATATKNYPLKYYTWGPKGQNSFRCGDGSLAMHWGTAQAYELLTSKWGKKLGITSGYRSPAYNARLAGAAKNSMHTHGRAIDVNINPADPNIEKFLQLAVESGFVGFGFYNTSGGSVWVHIDTGSGRIWTSGRVKPKSYWASILSKYGWKPSMKGLTLIKGAGTPQNNPPSSGEDRSTRATGPRMAGPLPAMSSTGTPFWQRGFKDPTNSFPTLQYRGRVSTNPLMMGVNSPNTPQASVGEKESGRMTGYSLPNAKGTFGEPPIPYAAMYPRNIVLGSLNHAIELDDTPGAERVNIQSGAGSFMEMDKNGTRVDRTTGDKHQYDGMNSYHGIEGDHAISANGNLMTYAGVDKEDHVNGNAKIVIKNDNTLEISGVYSLLAGEKVKVKTGKIYIEADEINFVANSKMFMQSKGEFHIKSQTLNIQTSGDTNLKSGGKFVTSADGAVSHKAGSTLTMSSSGVASMKSGSHVTLDGGEDVQLKAANSVKASGGTAVNLSGGQVVAAGGSNLANPPFIAGGTAQAPTGASAANDAAVATDATDADLGDPSGMERAQITDKPSYDSKSLTRPSYASHGQYGSTGSTNDAAATANDQSVNSSSYPSNNGGETGTDSSSGSGSSGGDSSNDGDASIGENYGQPASPAAGDNPSLFTPEGVQKYVNDFSYRVIKGGSVGKPSQDMINGYSRASRETSFPLDLYYLFAAYESNLGNNTGNSNFKGGLQQGAAYQKDAKKYSGGNPNVGPGQNGDYSQALATAYYIYNNKKSLEAKIGRQMNRADAYLIHFQGPGGAPVIIKNALDPAKRDQPIQPEGALSSAAINNNPSEFKKDGGKGKMRTWAEFYDRQCKKFGNQTLTPTQPKGGGTAANNTSTSPAAGPTGPQQ